VIRDNLLALAHPHFIKKDVLPLTGTVLSSKEGNKSVLLFGTESNNALLRFKDHVIGGGILWGSSGVSPAFSATNFKQLEKTSQGDIVETTKSGKKETIVASKKQLNHVSHPQSILFTSPKSSHKTPTKITESEVESYLSDLIHSNLPSQPKLLAQRFLEKLKSHNTNIYGVSSNVSADALPRDIFK